MSLADTWKAPLDLLEQDLWTVEQGLFVCAGYFKTDEMHTYDKLDKEYSGLDELGIHWNNVYFSIATGERFEHRFELRYFSNQEEEAKEAAAQEAVENILMSLDAPVRLWINSAHDTDERKVGSNDGDYFKEKWTKTYFIQWALRHRFELPWLNDAIKEGYVTGIEPIEVEAAGKVSNANARSDLQEYLIEITKSESDITAGKLLKRFNEELPDCIVALDTRASKDVKSWEVTYHTKSEAENEMDYAAFNQALIRAKAHHKKES
jgi:hypothetical protein